MREHVGWNAGPRVLKLVPHASIVAFAADEHRVTSPRELERISEQVREHLLDTLPVANNDYPTDIALLFDRDAFLAREELVTLQAAT